MSTACHSGRPAARPDPVGAHIWPDVKRPRGALRARDHMVGVDVVRLTALALVEIARAGGVVEPDSGDDRELGQRSACL